MSKGFVDTLVQKNQLYTEADFLQGADKANLLMGVIPYNLSLDLMIAVADLILYGHSCKRSIR